MINDNTILSSFNDRPTLLEWLKKVEEALKTDTATGVSVENPSVNSYIFKITFADGKTIASDTIRFPDSVKGASILNNHLVLTMQSGITDDLGVINPYADTIVLNSETNTTEIGNNAVVDGNLQVNGNVLFGNSIISIQGTTKQNGILGTNADGKIAFKEIIGGNELTAVVANPTENTTGTLSKIKIGNIAYGFVNNFMIQDLQFESEIDANHFRCEMSISLSERDKIKNGEIKIISGKFRYPDNSIGYYTISYRGIKKVTGDDYMVYEGVNINTSTSKLEKYQMTHNPKNSYIRLDVYLFNLTQA